MILHDFFFPIEKKYLPALKVIKQPLARVTYKVLNYGVTEVSEVGFAPSIAKSIVNYSGLLLEIEEAAKEHYKDECEKPEQEYNDLEQQESKYL